MAAYVRTVKTASGATAVQVVWSNKRGSKEMDHIGSAHTPEDVEVLKAAARQRMSAGQDELDFGDGQPRGKALPIHSTRAEHLWEALSTAFRAVGLEESSGGDEVFKHLVLARVIEPTSKLETIRVLDEIGIQTVSYPTINRRLPIYATHRWRRALSAGFAGLVGLGPATLILYDVTTLLCRCRHNRVVTSYKSNDTSPPLRSHTYRKQARATCSR